MARILDVYLAQDLVGHLEQDSSGALWFAYESRWVEHGVPLSASLPLRVERFKGSECRPFFAGLLPEEESRKLIARALGVSDRNDFALLERIGAECAGAVSLVPTGSTPPAGRNDYRPISLDELAARLAEVPSRPLMAGEDGVRLSLAGAQGKLALALKDGTYFLPLEGSPSTHILKPASPNFADLVENEFFCMKLAAATGLDVAEVEIGVAGIHRFLQVRRYDRTGSEANVRIHQEDVCQALGLPPEMKYQEEGGPSLKLCFELVRRISSVPGVDVLKLFEAVVFNFLIGNCDAHGKNFSFLYDRQSGTRLAPLYDLVCTRAYPGISATMAMKLGGEKNPERLYSKNWMGFIADVGLSAAAAKRRITDVVNRVTSALESLPADFPGRGVVAPIVSENCEALLLSVRNSG